MHAHVAPRLLIEAGFYLREGFIREYTMYNTCKNHLYVYIIAYMYMYCVQFQCVHVLVWYVCFVLTWFRDSINGCLSQCASYLTINTLIHVTRERKRRGTYQIDEREKIQNNGKIRTEQIYQYSIVRLVLILPFHT